jgi:hypothetical protein
MAALVRHDTTPASLTIAAAGDGHANSYSSEVRPPPVYSHHVPGRLRLRFDSLRDDRSALEAVRRELIGLPGVRSVSPNCLTGSVIVEYDSHILPPVALSEAMRERGFSCACPAATDAAPTFLTGHAAEVAAGRLFVWLVERLAISVIAAVI